MMQFNVVFCDRMLLIKKILCCRNEWVLSFDEFYSIESFNFLNYFF